MSVALAAIGTWLVGLGVIIGFAVAFILIIWLFFSEEGQELVSGIGITACVLGFPVLLIWGVYQIGRAILGGEA